MEAFRNNTKGYVYAVKAGDEDGEWDVCGYFGTAEPAYAHGMKQGRRFKIGKYRIVGFNGIGAKSKGCLPPYLLDTDDAKKYIRELDYHGSPDAEARYDKDGTLKYFWSYEGRRSDEKNISNAIKGMGFSSRSSSSETETSSGDFFSTNHSGYLS